MKLATRTNEFHSNGVQESMGYQVANSVHTMKILSGLYKDPILAAIRELSTNAVDAHVENNNEAKPFKLTLPTRDNKTLVIRDYGPGLSKEKMRQVYRVYGVSDKGDSNDFTGCLGLGSKSPFTYTDMWTTISYHKGTKYIGINSLNERGRPTFNIMAEEPTDEPDGLEVSFEVKSDDVGNCYNRAVKVYKWFDIVPDCNMSGLERDIQEAKRERNEKIAFEEDNWKVLTCASYGEISSNAIMGNIAYPLEGSQFSGQVKYLINNGIDIKFDMGEIDFAPSRDSLEYNRHTIAVITKRIQEIIETLKKKIEEDIDDCEFAWDARTKFLELVKGNFSNVYQIIAPKIEYKGAEISNSSYITSNDGVELGKFSRFNKNYNGQISRGEGEAIEIRGTTKFVVNDLKGKGHAALRRHIHAENNGKFYSFYLFYEDGTDSTDAAKYIVDNVGIDPANILFTSNFPKAMGTTGGGSKGVKKPANQLACQKLQDCRWGHANKNYWDSDVVNMDTGTYYYVVLNKDYSVITSGGAVWQASHLSDATKHGHGIEVYGLTQKRYEKIKDKKNWKKFEVSLKEHLDKWHAVPNNVKSLEIDKSRDYYENYKMLQPYLKQKTLMWKFLNTFTDVTNPDDMSNITRLVSLYDSFTNTKYVRPKSKTRFNTDVLNAKYPMLSVVDNSVICGNYYSKPEVATLKTVSNYINSIG